MKETEGELHRPTVEAIKAAIDVGYRHLDGAQCKLRHITTRVFQNLAQIYSIISVLSLINSGLQITRTRPS